MKSNEIHVIYGSRPFEMVKELLGAIGIEKEITKEMKVGIKPNLVVSKPARYGATTHPEMVAGVIEYLQNIGVKDIEILESSWVGDNTKRAFKTCGYDEISRKYSVPLFDLKDDASVTKKAGSMDIRVCKKAVELDYLINMPVLKAHCQTKFTCALKNLKGCIPDSEKRRFHALGLEKPIGCLGKAIKNSLIIVDAICGDLTFEEGGNPVQMDRIIAGKDPVLIDTYGASLIGYSADDIEYIKIAESMGVGSIDLDSAEIIEHSEDLKNGSRFKPSLQAERLTKNVVSMDACSACFGSLVHALQRIDDRGDLKRITEKICIGQGYRTTECSGLGIGNCTHNSGDYVKGCPPSAADILEFLDGHLK
jgi:Uncharacterized conserved protein